MFEDPVQWIIIGVIVIVIFLWGPNKIPDLAKSIGRARREFEMASKDIQGTAPEATNPQQGVAPPVQKSADQVMVETARSLGIQTEGKTRAQVAQEIVSRTSAS
jgi:sec-independent protein translocase protein TatA